MTRTKNGDAALHIIETVWNRGQTAAFDALTASDYVDAAYAPANAEGHKAMVEALKSVIPDAHWSVLSMVESEHEVVVELRLVGTHQGPFRGIAPRGNGVDVRCYRHFTFADGLLVRHAALLDTAALLRQMEADKAA